MSLELNISLSPSVSLQISAHNSYFGAFWGKRERGFALDFQHGPNANGKWLETWRNPSCGNLSVSAFGVPFMIDGGSRQAVPMVV